MPPKRVLPNPENGTREELETATQCAPYKRSFIRLLAMKELLVGLEFSLVARIHSISERTLVRWVAIFNQEGIDGLLDKKIPGRPRKLQGKKAQAYLELLEAPEKAEQRHWTGRKFHGYLRENFQEEVGYSTLMRFLREQGYRLKVPQPWSDRQDEQQRKAFCEQLEALTKDPTVELWFADETGIEGDPRPRRRWVQRGKKARVTKNGDHLRMNVTGAICPRTGQAYLLEFSHSDTQTFQAFLDEANKDLALERPRQLLILDNASWHKNQNLRWGRFEPLYLPPYSPDLNPIERLWLLMKAHWFSDFVAKSLEQLIERLHQALCWLLQRSQDNKKTCSIKTKL